MFISGMQLLSAEVNSYGNRRLVLRKLQNPGKRQKKRQLQKPKKPVRKRRKQMQRKLRKAKRRRSRLLI